MSSSPVSVSVSRSFLRDGQEVFEFRVPAFSESIARRRASVNGSLKGMESPEIDSVERIGSGSIPGQSVFLVTVVGER